MNASNSSARAVILAAASLAAFGTWRAASTAQTTRPAAPAAASQAEAQAAPQGDAPRYKLQRIVDVQGPGDGPAGLNNRGQVLLGTEGSKIVLWQDGKVRLLPAVASVGGAKRGRSRSSRGRSRARTVAIWDALDINDRGQIVGVAADGQACVFHNGKLQLLGALSDSKKWDARAANPREKAGFASHNRALAVNEAGDIVGTSHTPQPNERIFSGASEENAVQSWHLSRAGLGGALSLPTGKYGCYARDINDSGQVVGSWSQDTTVDGFSVDRAFVWDKASNTRRDLGLGFANAINLKGQIVGGVGNAMNDPDARALRWDNGQKSELGAGDALDINLAGQVVGVSTARGERQIQEAVLWQNGQQIMLQDRLDKKLKVRLDLARFINDRGQIVVRAYPTGDGDDPAFHALLTPIGG